MIKEDDLINDLNFCPTIYHAINMLKDKLLALDYTELDSNLEWHSPPPSNFFIIFKHKNIIAFNNKENSKGTFLIGNMKPSLFHIDKSSKIPTLDYNFCRVLSSVSKFERWNGRSMRIAGHAFIQDEKSKEIKEINIYSKRIAGIFPSKKEIDSIRRSINTENLSEQEKLYPLDIFLGLSRDCNPFINEFPGPIMKIISDELKIAPNLIQSPDLFFIDSNISNFIGSSYENNDRIVSGQNISQLCPPILAFNSFLCSQELKTGKENEFKSFILFDENEPTDSSFNEFLLNLFQKIGITNESLIINVIPIKNDKIENRIFFDTTNKNIESICNDKTKGMASKIQVDLHQNIISIMNSISNEVVKIGFPVSNFESPRERTSLNCLNFLKEKIEKILSNP